MLSAKTGSGTTPETSRSSCSSRARQTSGSLSSPQKGSKGARPVSYSPALTASIPSHVARDGTIAQRCEARATAAAYWAIKGNGTDSSKVSDPPTPLAVRQIDSNMDQNRGSLSSGWGSMHPFWSEHG